MAAEIIDAADAADATEITDQAIATDQERIESRAVHLLPEETAAGSDDARAQAAAILAESDLRAADRDADRTAVLDDDAAPDAQEPPD